MSMTTPRYAGFWIRFLAYGLDQFIENTVAGFLSGVVSFLVLIPLGIMSWDRSSTIDQWLVFFSGLTYVFVPASLGASLVNQVLCQWYLGASLGKRAFGLKVVDESTGLILDLPRSFLRFLSSIIAFLPLGLGYLVIAWTSKKQALHDFLCKTVVVYDEGQNNKLG